MGWREDVSFSDVFVVHVLADHCVTHIKVLPGVHASTCTRDDGHCNHVLTLRAGHASHGLCMEDLLREDSGRRVHSLR
jgi:hypothetical protein